MIACADRVESTPVPWELVMRLILSVVSLCCTRCVRMLVLDQVTTVGDERTSVGSWVS